MAELVAAGNTRLFLKSEDVLVGRRSNDGSFIPDVDLANLADGQTVSRRHARVFRVDGRWRLQVESSVTNDTVVGGRTLSAGEKMALTDGVEIRLDKVALVFQGGIEAPAANPDATIVRAIEAPAELRTDTQVLPLVVPEGRSLTLGRHTEDRSYRPDVDLGDLPGGRTVSRRHGSFYTRNGEWFMRVESTTTNDTQHNGTQLTFGQEIRLADGDQLQFGRVVTTFHEAPRVEAAGELIEVILDPPAVEVEAGGEAQMSVTIINHTGHIDFFKVEVEGLRKEWYKIILPNGSPADPALVQLFHTAAHGKASADALAKLRIVFAPRRDWKSRAGVHPIAVSATTQGEPRSRRVVASQVTIRRFEDVKFELSPPQLRGSRGTYRLAMQNLGNDVATVSVVAAGSGLESTWGDGTRGGEDGIRKQAIAEGRKSVGQAKDEVLSRFEPGSIQGEKKSDRQSVERSLGLASGGKDELVLSTRVQRRNWLGMDRNYVGAFLESSGKPGRSFFRSSFSSAPSAIVSNPIELSWSLDRAGPVTLESTGGPEKYFVADAKTDGKQTVKPLATISYTLTAHNQYLGFIG